MAKRFRSRLAALTLVAEIAIVLLPGCQQTLECGTWAFSGTPQGDSFPLNSIFTFNPTTCSQSCTCTTDCMTQIVWVYDTVEQTYLFPTSSYQARATSSGWVVDRVDGEGEGYYGLENDGSTFTSFWNVTGSNNTPETLIDDPSNWPANTWFVAVDVATCFASSTCANQILGYYVWGWTIDSTGTPALYFSQPAFKDLDTEFRNAVASWNAWAPNSGAESGVFSGEPALSHAQPFPTLTDL